METGIGSWTEQDIVTELHTKMRPNGEPVGGLMALVIDGGLSKITDADAMAVAQYLKSIPAINHNPYAQPLPSTGGDMNNLPFVLALLGAGVLLFGAGAFVWRSAQAKK